MIQLNTMTQSSKFLTFIILLFSSFLIASYFLFNKYLDTNIRRNKEAYWLDEALFDAARLAAQG